MAIYKKIGFKDWIDTKPDTYLIDNVPTEIKKYEDEIVERGTVLNAKNMNHLEEGIERNSIYLKDTIDKVVRQDTRITDVDKKATEAFQLGVKAKNIVVTSLNAKKVDVTKENTWSEIGIAIDNMKIGEFNRGDIIKHSDLVPVIELMETKSLSGGIIPIFTDKDEVVEYDTTIPLIVGGVTIQEKDINCISSEIINGEVFFYICFHTGSNYIVKTDKYKNYIVNQKLSDIAKKTIIIDDFIVVHCFEHFFKFDKNTLKQVNANNLVAEGFIKTKNDKMIVSMNNTKETQYMNNELTLAGTVSSHPSNFTGELKYTVVNTLEYLYGNQEILEDFRLNIKINDRHASSYETLILDKNSNLACGVIFKQLAYPWKQGNEFDPFSISYRKDTSVHGNIKTIPKNEGDYTKIHTTLNGENYFVNNNKIYKIKLSYKIKEV